MSFSRFCSACEEFRSTGAAKMQSKLSYCRGDSSNITLSLDTIWQAFHKVASEYKYKTAIVSCTEGIRKSFKELSDDVDNFSGGLLSFGLQKGSLVFIWSQNSYNWVVALLACARTGMIAVSANPAYKLNELKCILNLTKCEAILIPDHFKTQDFYGLLCAALPGLSTPKGDTLSLPSYPSLKMVIKMGSKKDPGTLTFAEVMERSSPQMLQKLQETSARVQFDDPFCILFTSGTTGVPKAAVHSHYTMLNGGLISQSKFTEDSISCNPMPLFHLVGIGHAFLVPLLNGSTIVLPSPCFNAESVVEALQNEKCNFVIGSYTMFVDILSLPNLDAYDLSSLKRVRIGGSVPNKTVIQNLMSKLNVSLLISYGMTETYSCAGTELRDPTEFIDCSVGKIRSVAEVKIVDENGRIVNTGECGEILIRSPAVFQGYWKNPESTARAFSPGNWCKSGDFGRLDSSGYLYFVGRLKDTITRGGENIHPREIEELLLSHPAIDEVYVIGVSDARMVEELCACIQLRNHGEISEDDVKLFLKGQISHFKIPKYVLFRSSFPRTFLGKVEKKELKKEIEDSRREYHMSHCKWP